MVRRYLKIFRENKFIFLFSIAERIFFFLFFLILARKFPTGIYGEIITVFSLANIFAVMFDLGLPLLLQRTVSMKEKSAPEILRDILLINIFSFPLYMILLVIYSMIFFSGISFLIVASVGIIVYLYTVSNILNKALSGLNEFRSQLKILVLSRGITLLLFLCLIIFFNSNILILLLVLPAGALLQILYLAVTLRKSGLLPAFDRVNLDRLKDMLRISIPLGLAIIFNFLYDKIDIIIISQITGFDSAAFYNVAYGIYKTSALSYSFLFVSGFTRISYFSKKKSAVKLFFKKYFFILLWISLALTIILFLFAGPFIQLIYTDKFSDAAVVLKILSFASFGLAINNLTGIILNGLGLFKMNMVVTLIGLIINVILNLIFVPKYGIIAAAYITIVTEYFILSGDLFFIRKFLKS